MYNIFPSVYTYLHKIIIIMHTSTEANDANNLPEEQKEIYDRVFKSHGMKLVDFLHLMSIAERHEIKRNEKLVELGMRVYLFECACVVHWCFVLQYM